MIVEHVGEVGGGLNMEGFVSEEKDLVFDPLWDGEPVAFPDRPRPGPQPLPGLSLSPDAQVFRRLPGVLPGASPSTLPSLPVFRCDSGPLPHGLVSQTSGTVSRQTAILA